MSTHATVCPESAKHTPATSPTYPVPTTAIRIARFYRARQLPVEFLQRSPARDRGGTRNDDLPAAVGPACCLLLNFNVAKLTDGLRRVVNCYDDPPHL